MKQLMRKPHLDFLKISAIVLLMVLEAKTTKAQDFKGKNQMEIRLQMKDLPSNEARVKLARQYINQELIALPEAELYNKEILEFISSYVSSKDNKAFALFYPNGKRAAEVMGPQSFLRYGSTDISKIVLKRVVKEDYIDPLMVGTKIPDWKKLENDIAQKFGKAAVGNWILDAKIDWYKHIGEWNKVGELNIQNVENNKWLLDQPMVLNSACWSVFFEKVTDQSQLKKATKWMEHIVTKFPPDAAYFDTYANLLYKTGNVRKAIEWEEKAVALRPNEKEFKDVLEKMKSGEKTW